MFLAVLHAVCHIANFILCAPPITDQRRCIWTHQVTSVPSLACAICLGKGHIKENALQMFGMPAPMHAAGQDGHTDVNGLAETKNQQYLICTLTWQVSKSELRL